jgi:hypothetical protein
LPPSGRQPKFAQIEFKPDWTRHANVALFKRNGALLYTLPADVVMFPDAGIQENLANEYLKLGVPVWWFGGGDGGYT